MASTTTCPTVNTTCPTTGYRFEPTGTYNPMTMPANWCDVNAVPAFPPTKTYSSIFNKDMPIMPPTVMPPMMVPTPVPTSLPMVPMMMTPMMTPYMTPKVPMPTTMPLPSWCYSPMTTPFGLPTAYPTFDMMMMSRPFCMPFETPMPTPFGLPVNPITNDMCSFGFRPSNPVELYCLTNPIRVCDREGNRMLCLNFDFRGYKPEEITVTLNKTERCIVVEAAHEVKESKEHHVMRKFCRKFVLPVELAKVDLSKCEIQSCLTAEGCLCIEMPLPKMTTEEIAKCPIMSRAAVSPLFNSFYRCPSVVYNTKPVACKIN